MQVVEQTETRLVLRELPWLVCGVGALLAGSGAYVALFGGEVAFGAIFVAIGLAAILGWGRTVTCTFDRGTGLFTREGGGWVASRRVEVPLTEITRVRLGRTHGMNPSYRVELSRSSGDAVALTPSYGSGKRDKEDLAERIRGFLGITDPGEVPIPGFRDLARMILDPTAANHASPAYDEAIARHEAAVQRDPHDADAYRELATALALRGRPAEASARLRTARDLLAGSGKGDDARKLDEMIARLDDAAARMPGPGAPSGGERGNGETRD